jgi:protein ImuB
MLSVYLPTWPVDLVRRRRLKARSRRSGTVGDTSAEAALILIVRDQAQRQLVVSGCLRCAAAGVRAEMTLPHARALLPHGAPLCVQPHRPAQDLAALRALAQWATRFTPRVAVDPPDGLILDITGCQRVFGGEKRILRLLGDELLMLGVANRLAVADTLGCAWAVARYDARPRARVISGEQQAVLMDLPPESLRLDDDLCQALREVGVERVGHLLALPRHELPARFGDDLLLRLDQALGRAIETIDALRPVDPVQVERLFDGPCLQLEAILLAARELVGSLCAELRSREAGALSLRLTLGRVDVEPIHLDWSLSRPSRSERHLWSLLRPRVESAHLGFGVESLTLRAERAAAVAHVQLTQGHEQEREDRADPAALGQLLDTLVGRLGRRHVGRFEPVESHLPERVFVGCSVMEEDRRAGPAREAATLTVSDRPSILLPHPEPIDVVATTPDGPPVLIRWRGREYRLSAALGPERLADRWWDSPQQPLGSDLARDYFKVQEQAGQWWWVYRQWPSHRWFIHGQWG